MAEFKPSQVDFAGAMQAREAQQRTQSIERANREQRIQDAFNSGMEALKGGMPVKVMLSSIREFPADKIPLAEWTEKQLKKQAERAEQTAAAQGTDDFAGLQDQVLAAQGGTPSQKQAASDRIAPFANNPNVLNQLAGGVDTLKAGNQLTALGQTPEQLGGQAIKVDDERRKLAAKLGDVERKKAAPKAQAEDMRAQMVLDIAAGKEIDPNIKAAVDEMNRTDPFNRLLSAMIQGQQIGAPMPSPADSDRTKKILAKEFASSSLSKDFKIVPAPKNDRFFMDNERAGRLIIANKKTGEMMVYAGQE